MSSGSRPYEYLSRLVAARGAARTWYERACREKLMSTKKPDATTSADMSRDDIAPLSPEEQRRLIRDIVKALQAHGVACAVFDGERSHQTIH